MAARLRDQMGWLAPARARALRQLGHPRAPLIAITMFVQVIAVTLLPAALMFLILLLNDKPLMGAYVNTRWENVANWSITLFVIIVSTLFGISVLFPSILGQG